MTLTAHTTIWHVIDLESLDLMRLWLIDPNNNGQLIMQQVGEHTAWLAAVTDHATEYTPRTTRAHQFVTEFGSAIQEITNA